MGCAGRLLCGDRSAAIERVAKLAEMAVSRAGIDWSVRAVSMQQRSNAIEGLLSSIRSRTKGALERIIGIRGYRSAGPFRRSTETCTNLVALIVLPLLLIVTWPYAAIVRRGLHRAQERERAGIVLRDASKTYLILWFEINADRGELAAKIKRNELLP